MIRKNQIYFQLMLDFSKKNSSFALAVFGAYFALIMKRYERRSFCARDWKYERRSRHAHEIKSGALGAAHMSAALYWSGNN